ncbi:MAG: M6 family metalloprotease domain-containing protein [candidate division Zixibacteria bacterium]
MSRIIMSIIFSAVLLLHISAIVCAVPPTEEVIQKLKDEGRFDRFVERMMQARAKGVNSVPLPDAKGLQNLTLAPNQTYRVLILLIDFPDKSYTEGWAAGMPGDFDSLLLSDGLNPTGSMKEYYYQNSYGNFTISGDIYGWYTADNGYEYYTNYCDGSHGVGSYPNNAQKLVEEVVDAADGDVDFSLYDNDNDGYMDGIFVVHAGTGFEETGDMCEIWSHKWGINPRYKDGVWINLYSVQPEESHGVEGLISIGIYCHEFAHILGLPDLYDYDGSSFGASCWAAMSGGIWHDYGRKPSQFCIWSKYKLGWLSPINILANQTDVSIPAIEWNPVGYRLWYNGTGGNEYFLVENRQLMGFDTLKPGAGLIIWHIDDNVSGNNDDWHPQVFLEQADGRFDLQNSNNYGDENDPYPNGGASPHFHDKTIPNSRDYLDQSTQVAAWNISASDSVMTADFDVTWSRPYLILTDYTFNDATYGDGDGILEEEERIELILNIQNDWKEATGAMASLTVNDVNLILIDFSSSLGTISTGGSANNSADPFTFDIPIGFIPRVDSFFVEISSNGGADVSILGIEQNVGDANFDAPGLVSNSPPQHELNVTCSSNISVTFDNDMDETTINSSTLVVNAEYTGLHQGVISYDGATKSATLYPTHDFDEGEVVTVVLTTDIRSSVGISLNSSYIWSFTTAVDNGLGSFNPQIVYPVGSGPFETVAADLDGDGDIDLATANYFSFDVSVILNDGTGSFGPQSAYPIGVNPTSITAGDLDGDGDLDLVSANMTSSDVSVLLNNGVGTFAPQVAYPVYGYPESVFAADLDADGDLDLAVACWSNKVSILKNKGDGTFSPYLSYSVNPGVASVFAGDFDADGDLDLVTANRDTDDVSVLMNNGDASFAAHVTYSVGDWPYYATVADLNGDGYLDLATANHYDDNISVLMNNGNGTFGMQSVYPAGDGVQKVVAADFDDDGDLDLAGENWNSWDVSVLLNTGTGTFDPQVTYSAGTYPRRLAAADLDNDGDIDIAVSNGYGDNVSVLLNQTCFDSDGDGYGNPGHPENDCLDDNCPEVYNSNQTDTDSDMVGDSCDVCPGYDDNIDTDEDGVPDDCDLCEGFDDNIDIDENGIPDGCDFICGDANSDDQINVGDAVFIINHIFKGGPAPDPIEAGDANCDLACNVGDAVYLINHVFKSGPAPCAECK